MEATKYVNLIEISPVVIDTGGVENSELVVIVNNTFVCHMAFFIYHSRNCRSMHLLTNH